MATEIRVGKGVSQSAKWGVQPMSGEIEGQRIGAHTLKEALALARQIRADKGGRIVRIY